MSLQQSNPMFVPEETARVAKAIYRKGNLAIHLRDELAGIYRDELFADLYPVAGRAAEAPWRLALVTVLQFAEDLPDREAADAVRDRIDWKYALGLELTDTGFDFTVLSKFRKRLARGNAAHRLLDELLTVCDEPVPKDRIGEVVPRGGVLGIEGMSGAATGYHLHAELLDDMGGDIGVQNRRDNQDPRRFYERFYNSLESGREPTAARDAAPANNRVDVYHHGLDNVRVEGLEPAARQRAEDSLKGFGEAIRQPKSHSGFG